MNIAAAYLLHGSSPGNLNVEAAFRHVLADLRQIAKDRHGISHVTLQLETSEADCTEVHHLNRASLRETA
ncbi:hypothetical protein [Candidatus Poriferisodalis sp.]|uniref:hypothetical protein n=1 Tax=Candidatus Poriferisodalis sp. TaxID=3101277 RepID=UPI003B522D15